MTNAVDAKWQELSLRFWIACAFIVFIALFGGSSRLDVQSLVLLRPLSILAFGISILGLTMDCARKHAGLLGLLALTWMLVILQMIPLPPSVWSALPSRGVVSGFDAQVGLANIWRSSSMSPLGTVNAFWAFCTPSALAILCIQLNRNERALLLPLLLLIGLTSGIFGLIQSIGGAEGSFYFYHTTNRGAGVGLFANRNHQAVLLACLLPMLAAYCSINVVSRSRRKLMNMLALAIGGALIPLILVTGSRSGLILGSLALLSVPFIYRNPAGYDATQPAQIFSTVRQYLLAAVTVAVLATVTILMSRGEAFQRMSKTDQMEDLRFKIWNPIASAAEAYFPIGSGSGSIVQIYQLHEPDDLLIANYVNQAHNDALDIILTMGVAGAIVAASSLIWIIWKSRSAWQNRSAEVARSSILARLGSVIALLWIMGSLGDYPLRTPLAASVFIVALVWINSVSHTQPKKLEVSSSFS